MESTSKLTANYLKTSIDVEVAFINDTKQKGSLFLAQGQRLQDLLNGSRDFLPFELHAKNEDASFSMLNKSNILFIRLID